MANVQQVNQCKRCGVDFIKKVSSQLHCTNRCARLYANRLKKIREIGIPKSIQNLQNEFWKPIAGYDGLYEVSNLGRVKCLSKKGSYNEKILYSKVNVCGYFAVRLTKENKMKTFTIHRLVAIAFLGYKEGMEVNHIDCNRQNNNLYNLEWVTRSENIKHSYDYGKSDKVGIKNGRAILSWDKVYKIKELINMGAKLVDIARVFEVKYSVISSISIGRTWDKTPKN